MLNIVKADWYRLKNHKGLYITFVLLILMLVLYGYGTSGTIGVSVDDRSAIFDDVLKTGQNMPFWMLNSMDNQLYFLLAFVVFIAASDFSSQTAKNVIASGVTRFQYVAAKYILSCLFAFVIVILTLVIPTVTATLLNGFGGTLPAGYVTDVLKAYSLVMFIYVAMTSLGLMLVFSTKRIAMVNSMYIVFCMVPMILIMLLTSANAKFEKLFDYELMMNLRHLADIHVFTTTDYARVIIMGLGLIVLSMSALYLSFRKCDIK